jgi:hypothetical protein
MTGLPGGHISSKVGYRPNLSWNIRNIFAIPNILPLPSPLANASTNCPKVGEANVRGLLCGATLLSRHISP